MSNQKELHGNPKKYSKARAAVLRYFLKLFIHQINAPAEAPFEVRRIDTPSFGPLYDTFELRVQHAGEWAARRMTIAPLGSETGSKSICFYVIYDDHIVVKIPSPAITELTDYLDCIYADQRIVFRMKPRECVVPGVSVILKRVHSFPNNEPAPEKMEGRYISWLKKNPEFQQFLKIEDAYIFFMDLSKYGILGDILNKMHFESKNRFVEEITGNRGIIPEYHNFEGRYGQKKGTLGYDLQKLHTEFEAGAGKILLRHNIKPSLFQYKMEEWFLLQLACKKIEAPETEIPPDTVSELNEFSDKLLSDHPKTVQAYRDTVTEYLDRKYFTKNKLQMEGIVTNILDLLAWLKQQGVAMRDFKPENILVTGNPEKNPNFLSSPKEYTLGLIDTETSVIYKELGGKEMEQPLLGGTPFYANPTQFFNNSLLKKMYGDAEHVLCLQDWYAAVAMIYFVVTGDRLFNKTARKLSPIIDIIGKGGSSTDGSSDLVQTANQTFWEMAVQEFNSNMNQKIKILTSLKANIPEKAGEMLLDALRSERLRLTERIKEKTNSTQISGFKGKEDSGETNRHQPENESPKTPAKNKNSLEQLDKAIKSLTSQHTELTIFDLLELMFNMVLCGLTTRIP